MSPQSPILPVDSSPSSSASSVSSLSPPSSPQNDHSRREVVLHDDDVVTRSVVVLADSKTTSNVKSSFENQQVPQERASVYSPRFRLPPKPPSPRRTRSSSNDSIGTSPVSSPEKTTTATTSTTSTAASSSTSLRSPRFSRSAMKKSVTAPTSTGTPPRPRHLKKPGGVRWSLHEDSIQQHRGGHRGRLDSTSSTETLTSGTTGSYPSSSSDDDDDGDSTSDASDTVTSHTTTTTAAAHNRSGSAASMTPQQRIPAGDGASSVDDEWRRKVRDVESRLEAAVRRHQLRQRQAAALGTSSCPDDECDLEIPYCDTLLGNLFFRQGGGGCLSSYQRAECHYLRAIDWCERRHRNHRTPRLLVLVADARANLGAVLWTTGRVDAAVPALEKALEEYELYRSVVGTRRAQDGSNPRLDVSPVPELDVRVANVWHQLGLAHCLQGSYGESLECLQRALHLRQQRTMSIAESDAKIASVASAALDVASTYDAMGKVLACQGEWRVAVLHHQQAAELLLALAPLRAMAVVKTVVRSCLQRTVSKQTELEAVKDIKSWLDGMIRQLSGMRSAAGAVNDKEMTTVRRELRDAIAALGSHLTQSTKSG